MKRRKPPKIWVTTPIPTVAQVARELGITGRRRKRLDAIVAKALKEAK